MTELSILISFLAGLLIPMLILAYSYGKNRAKDSELSLMITNLMEINQQMLKEIIDIKLAMATNDANFQALREKVDKLGSEQEENRKRIIEMERIVKLRRKR